MDEEADACVLLILAMANDGQLPLKTCIKLDINFLQLKVPNVGFLILEEPNRVLEKKHHTNLPGHHRLEFNMVPISVFHRKIRVRKI